MADLDNDSLSAGEQAYFDSKGETPVEIKDDPPASEETASDGQEPGPEQEGQGEGQQQERQRTRMVPHQALHEAREETKREREERRRFEETVNQRLALLAQAQAPREEPKAPPPPPDAAIDPLGRMEYLENLVKEQGQTHQQQLRQAQETHVRSQVAQFSYADEQNARSQAPDYDAAKNHLMLSRGRELFLASGGSASEQQIRAQLASEEESLRVQAIQRGVRPSVVLYQMAVARGYTPKQAAAAATGGDDKIAALADAQAANKTLSSAGGGAADGPMTAQRLANMSAEEFEAYSAKNGKTVRKLMGG